MCMYVCVCCCVCKSVCTCIQKRIHIHLSLALPLSLSLSLYIYIYIYITYVVYSAECQAAPKQTWALLSFTFWLQKAHGTHPAFLKAAQGLRPPRVKGLKSDIAMNLHIIVIAVVISWLSRGNSKEVSPINEVSWKRNYGNIMSHRNSFIHVAVCPDWSFYLAPDL